MQKIHPADVRKVWDEIRWPIFQIKQDMKMDWRPEDVYAALVNNQAGLYVGGEKDMDFMVVRTVEDRFTGETVLFIWIAYSPSDTPHMDYLDDIREVARQVGATKIRMESPRKGWSRLGWTPRFISYEMEVPR